MSLRQYITIMLIATILCWVSWIFVIINIDPFEATSLSFFFFYTSLFFALVGTISLVSFSAYSLLSRVHLPMFRYVQKSFRDSLFISAFLTVLLYLQGAGLLNLWNSIFLLATLFSFLIFLFFNKKAYRA